MHLFAGLNGAGKTTFARRLERELPAVRFSLDEWMLRLQGPAFDDPRYPEAATRCRDLIWDTATQVLHTHTSVVLDWNQWSRVRRAEWVSRTEQLGVPCVLHYVTVPLRVAVEQATTRMDAMSHQLDGDDVRHLSELFEPPEENEGFSLDLVPHRAS